MYLCELTNGETTINLFDKNTVYIKGSSWQPQVSRWQDGRYASITESIPVVIRGASGTAVLTRLRELIQIIDEAARFRRGESVLPLWLRYQQTVSGVIWTVLVIGGQVIVPETFTEQANMKGLLNVSLELDRRGQWLSLDASNLLSNNDLEDWTEGEPSNWLLDINSVGATITEENTIVHLGSASANLDDVSIDDILKQEVTGMPIGVTVRASAWVYVTAGAALMRVSDGNVNMPPAGYDKIDSTQGEWYLLTAEYTTTTTNVLVFFSGAYDSTSRSSFYVDTVTLTILSESGSAGDVAEATGTNGDSIAFSLTNGREKFPSPTMIAIDDVRFGSRHKPGYVLLAAAGSLYVENAGDLTPASKYTAVADAAAYPRGANILRYTPTDTLAYGQVLDFPIVDRNLRGDARRAIFANVRNNSATHDGYVYLYVARYGIASTTRPVLVPAHSGTAAPQWYYVGEVRGEIGASITLFCKMDGTGSTIDIDGLVMAWMDDGRTSVVQVDSSSLVGTSAAGRLIVDHRHLTGMTPAVQVTDNTSDVTSGWSARGDLEIYTKGLVLQGALLMTGASGSVNAWRQVNSVTVVENDWRVSRLPARLIPE